jgi:hypothetical protein
VGDFAKGMLPAEPMSNMVAAAKRLQEKGLPLTKTNLAVEMAEMGKAPVMEKAAPAPGMRTAPAGSAEARAEKLIEEKKRQGPPPGMLEGRRARILK